MRLVFLGSPPFALPIFRSLIESSHEVGGLVTQPDRRRGRGRTVEVSPLVKLARAAGMPVLQPETTKDPIFITELESLRPDVLMVASYGEILREDVLTVAPHGALNVHASLLPRWRGASPVQAAIRAGDRVTGVSVQRIVRALDAGDVLLSLETEIGPHETAGELVLRLADLGAEAAVQALDRLDAASASPQEAVFTPQDPALVTHASKLKKSDGALDFSLGSIALERLVRAYTPWPGAQTTLPDGRALLVLHARPVPTDELSAAQRDQLASATPGALIDASSAFLVATGPLSDGGALELCTVKPSGKGAMDGVDFLRGARLETGERIGAREG